MFNPHHIGIYPRYTVEDYNDYPELYLTKTQFKILTNRRSLVRKRATRLLKEQGIAELIVEYMGVDKTERKTVTRWESRVKALYLIIPLINDLTNIVIDYLGDGKCLKWRCKAYISPRDIYGVCCRNHISISFRLAFPDRAICTHVIRRSRKHPEPHRCTKDAMKIDWVCRAHSKLVKYKKV